MADLIAFPQRCNVGKARHVARLWLGRPTEREREVYWQAVQSRLARSLARIGFGRDEILAQVTEFAALVRRHLDERGHLASTGLHAESTGNPSDKPAA